MINSITLILTWNNINFVYLLAAVNLVFFVFTLLHRSYESWVHWLGIIFNQIIILIWLGIIIVLNKMKIEEKKRYLLMFVLVVLMIMMDVIAGVRIVVELYYRGSQINQFRQLLQNNQKTNKK